VTRRQQLAIVGGYRKHGRGVTGPYDPLTYTYGTYGFYGDPNVGNTGVPAGSPALTVVSDATTLAAAVSAGLIVGSNSWDNSLKRLRFTGATSSMDLIDLRGYVEYIPSSAGGLHRITRSQITAGVLATSAVPNLGLVICTHANATNVKIYDCDLHCWYPNSYGYDGIRGRGFEVHRTEMKWCLDAIGTGFNAVANCHAFGVWSHDHGWAWPDYATPSHDSGTNPGTHNDAWQIFGGTINEAVGCFFEGNIAPGTATTPAGILVGRPAGPFLPFSGGVRNQYGHFDDRKEDDLTAQTQNTGAAYTNGNTVVPRSYLQEVANASCQMEVVSGVAMQWDRCRGRGGSFGQVNIPASMPGTGAGVLGSITNCKFGTNSRAGTNWNINTNGQQTKLTLSNNVLDTDNTTAANVR